MSVYGANSFLARNRHAALYDCNWYSVIQRVCLVRDRCVVHEESVPVGTNLGATRSRHGSFHPSIHRRTGTQDWVLCEMSDTFPSSNKTQLIILFNIYFESSDLRQIFFKFFRFSGELVKCGQLILPLPTPDRIDFLFASYSQGNML